MSRSYVCSVHDGNGTRIEKRSWSSTGVKDVLYSGSLVFNAETSEPLATSFDYTLTGSVGSGQMSVENPITFTDRLINKLY